MKRKLIFAVICIYFLSVLFPVYALEEEEEETSTTAERRSPNIHPSLDVYTADEDQRIMLARSNVNYMVTPGDVYTLVFTLDNNQQTHEISVDTSYRVRVMNLMVINAAGKTFPQLKREIEDVVIRNYPLSGAHLSMTQPAVFHVYVNGEVYKPGEAAAWALSRLSSLAGENLTEYACIRNVSVRSSNGQTQNYDLFRAQRLGDLSQDPYLRPGDVITFNRNKRVVTITGAVERPGTYQLLDDDNMKDLIEYYGNGFTPLADKTRSTLIRYIGADEISGEIHRLSEEELTGEYELYDRDNINIPSITNFRPAVHANRMDHEVRISGAVRQPGTYQLLPHENLKELVEVYAGGLQEMADINRIELTRYINSTESTGEKIYITGDDILDNYALEHLDSIYVPSIIQLRSVIFIDGAIDLEDTVPYLLSSSLEVSSNRITVDFSAGETYASLVRRNSGWFNAVSDIENAYVLRRGERIHINLIPILHDFSYQNNLLIQEGDTLVIPFKQFFITVSGAVNRPGRYPYFPDRTWDYYIALAGGFIKSQNVFSGVRIVDLNGEKISKKDIITPDTVITARTNNPFYYVNQMLPAIGTTLSILTFILVVR